MEEFLLLKKENDRSVIMENREELVKAAKEWFGDGDVDVDLLLNYGIIQLETIVRLYEKEVLKKV